MVFEQTNFAMMAIKLMCALLFLLVCGTDSRGVNVEWDVLNWTTDGYQALVTLDSSGEKSFSKHAWAYGWTWAKKEVIWELEGAKVQDQGNCTRFIGNKPLACDRSLVLVPAAKKRDKNEKKVVSFLVTVGEAGMSTITVDLPKNFTLKPGYHCGAVKESSAHKKGALKSWESLCA